jgi:hypothetical protein
LSNVLIICKTLKHVVVCRASWHEYLLALQPDWVVPGKRTVLYVVVCRASWHEYLLALQSDLVVPGKRTVLYVVVCRASWDEFMLALESDWVVLGKRTVLSVEPWYNTPRYVPGPRASMFRPSSSSSSSPCGGVRARIDGVGMEPARAASKCTWLHSRLSRTIDSGWYWKRCRFIVSSEIVNLSTWFCDIVTGENS